MSPSEHRGAPQGNTAMIAVFICAFEQGELGDAKDFYKWSATFEMLQNLEK